MSYTNINRVVLVGRLTAAPELRALPSGVSVCNLRLACNGRRKGEDGEYEQKPNFFGVSVYGHQAETVHRYMRRGRRVGVDGRLEWREWETADGAKRQTVEIVADSVEFLDGGGSAEPAGRVDDDEDGETGADDALERELVGVGTGIDDELEF